MSVPARKTPSWRGVLWAAGIVGALAVTAVGGFFLGRAQSAAEIESAPAADREGLALYAEALGVVRDDYVDRGAADPKEQARGAIEGMLDTLGDEGHTRFLTPEEREAAQEGLSGSYAGVGVQLEEERGRAVVAAPLAGSPAKEAGIRPGDVLTGVDGRCVAAAELAEIAGEIKGPEGSEVTLTLRRGGPDGREDDVVLTRRQIEAPAASWGLVGEAAGANARVGVVKLATFDEDSGTELLDAFEEAGAAGAEAFVLDLRDNPGGELEEATLAASHFLEAGDVVYVREEAGGERQKVRVPEALFGAGDGPAVREPLVLLVDGDSASSSEILAGALRDNGRAKVLGDTTAGTGTVLSEFPISDDSSILLGVAEWLTPGGDFIRETGISPDVEVGLKDGQRPLLVEEAEGMTVAEISAEDAQLGTAVREVSGEASRL